jgi:hypothetical protein
MKQSRFQKKEVIMTTTLTLTDRIRLLQGDIAEYSRFIVREAKVLHEGLEFSMKVIADEERDGVEFDSIIVLANRIENSHERIARLRKEMDLKRAALIALRQVAEAKAKEEAEDEKLFHADALDETCCEACGNPIEPGDEVVITREVSCDPENGPSPDDLETIAVCKACEKVVRDEYKEWLNA